MNKYSINEEQLKEVITIISKLNPKPGSYSGGGKPIEQVIPDFKISIENNELILELNYRNSPTLNISRDYDEMLRGYKLEKNKSKSQREAIQFIKKNRSVKYWRSKTKTTNTFHYYASDYELPKNTLSLIKENKTMIQKILLMRLKWIYLLFQE